MSAKRSQTEKDDNRLLKTIETINNLKESLPLYAEFVKAVHNNVKALNTTIATGRAVTESLKRLGDQTGGDIGVAVNKLCDTENSLLDQQMDIITKISEQLIASYIDKETGRLPADKADLTNFEKNFKAKRSASLKVLKKAESKAASANKPKAKAKKPDVAAAANQALDEAVFKHDELLTALLKEIVILQRKRGCLFLTQFTEVMNTRINNVQQGLDMVIATRDNLAPLLNSAEILPEDIINICEGKGATVRSSSFGSSITDGGSPPQTSPRPNGEWDVDGSQIAVVENVAAPIPYDFSRLDDQPVQTPAVQVMAGISSPMEDLDNMINNFDFESSIQPPQQDATSLALEAAEIDELLGNL